MGEVLNGHHSAHVKPMNIIEILRLIAVIVPSLAQIVEKIFVAIHSAPGTPEHAAAITTQVVSTKE